MVVGVLFQLPSGLANGGLFNFVAESSTGSDESYAAGFRGRSPFFFVLAKHGHTLAKPMHTS